MQGEMQDFKEWEKITWSSIQKIKFTNINKDLEFNTIITNKYTYINHVHTLFKCVCKIHKN